MPIAFIFSHLLFLGLGVVGVGLNAVERQQAPEWAYSFLPLPAVWTSLDHRTVDLAFLAVFVWVPPALLCLERETGLLAVGAVAAWHVYYPRWHIAAQVASRFEMQLWQ